MLKEYHSTRLFYAVFSLGRSEFDMDIEGFAVREDKRSVVQATSIHQARNRGDGSTEVHKVTLGECEVRKQ